MDKQTKETMEEIQHFMLPICALATVMRYLNMERESSHPTWQGSDDSVDHCSGCSRITDRYLKHRVTKLEWYLTVFANLITLPSTTFDKEMQKSARTELK